MRMFGFIGNRADLGARVLELSPEVLRVKPEPGGAVGWGIGFFQSGEILLRRRPLDEREDIDLVEVTSDVRTDVLIGHVRRPTVGNLRTENTHPFRYRQWLFASTSTIGDFDKLRDGLLQSQPEFLQRNVRGDTDSECLFYLFLSFLHDAGHLRDEAVDPAQVRAALRASLALVERMSKEAGAVNHGGSLLVTHGDHLFAVHRDGGLAYRVVEGSSEVEGLLEAEELRQRRIPSIESTHFNLVATDMPEVPESWTAVPEGSLLTLGRSAPPAIESL